MKRYCYFNGKIRELKNAKIDPYDIGILRGYAVFDFLTTQNDKPFLWRDHFRRFKRSARELRLTMPIAEKEFEEIILKLVKKHHYKNNIIRSVLTGGVSSNGFIPDGKPVLYILIEKAWSLPRAYYNNGVPLISIEYQRTMPLIKTSNYIEALRHNHLRHKAQALEILYTSKGKALECASSNFFIVKNNKIITPKDDVLLGITRKLVLHLAKKHYQIIERPIRLRELQTADEAFITASGKHMVPVTKIDKKLISDGKVGSVSIHIMKLYKEFAKKY